MNFSISLLNKEDLTIARRVLDIDHDARLCHPDLVISPDGKPYLYRWHITRTPQACVYFHIQIGDDPERPLHDHPWDNFSVILAGGYTEILSEREGPPGRIVPVFNRKKGDVITRKAGWPHRLLLPAEHPYTMTLFSTGPKVREWGFWYPTGWKPYTDVTRTADGQSVHIHPTMGD